jgi:hypothetical protein
MHPWHDSYVDDDVVEQAFPVIVEILHGRKRRRVPCVHASRFSLLGSCSGSGSVLGS